MRSYIELRSVGYNIGTLFYKIWDVSNGAIESGNWDGLWKLSLLTSLLQPLGLLLLCLLPKNSEDQEKLQRSDYLIPSRHDDAPLWLSIILQVDPVPCGGVVVGIHVLGPMGGEANP